MVPGRRKTTIWLNVGKGAMVNANWVGEMGSGVVRTGREGRIIPTGERGAVAIGCCVGRRFYVAVDRKRFLVFDANLLNS